MTVSINGSDGGTAVTTTTQKVLQVVSVSKSDTYTSSGTTFADITGLAASITPSATTSKIMVIIDVGYSFADVNNTNFNLRALRDATVIAAGDTAGSRDLGFFGAINASAFYSTYSGLLRTGVSHLDSPSSTSSLIYKVQGRISFGSNTFYINRSATDTDSSRFVRSSSTITLMEIGA
tara:strand:+ start:26 stop:559 length:534 start_codon:yes stop_codon:yes gene_type:complete